MTKIEAKDEPRENIEMGVISGCLGINITAWNDGVYEKSEWILFTADAGREIVKIIEECIKEMEEEES